MKLTLSINRSFSVRVGLFLILVLATFGVLPTHVARADTYTVTNTNDSGTGSLRQAILDAESHGGADQIAFDASVSGTITLASALPTITQDLTITGPGADRLAISGNDTYRVFAITGGTVSISGLTITAGYPDSAAGAFGLSGAGIYVASSADVTLRDCAITHNTLPSDTNLKGAGILSVGDLTIERCTISHNDAADNSGGGIFAHLPSLLSVTASTISGNSADYGGGILVYNAIADVNSSTVTNNTANVDDGGITVDTNGVITLTNSIVAGNVDADGGDYPDVDEFFGDINSGGYNVIGIDDDSVISGDGATGDQVGTSGSPLDPHLGPLADNSGRTQTHALLAGSPALDAIPEGGNAYNGASATDQRGFDRPMGDNADVGAYEWEPFYVESVSPAHNAMTVPLDSSVVVTYTAPVSATTVTSRTVAVHGMMQGLITGTHSTDGRVVTVDPTRDFFPGEPVYAVATIQTTNVTGTHPLTATQWQFIAAVSAGDGDFDDSGQNLAQNDSFDVALGDLDGDGDLDAFIANGSQGSHDGANRVWTNDGHGSFTNSGQTLGSSNSRDATLGDVDNDGDLDAFVSNQGGNKVWLNDGSGAFTDSGQSLGSANSFGTALGDVDSDGDLDAVVANASGNGEICLNNGGGTFTCNSGPATASGRDVALGDLDGDGDLDAVVVNYGNPHTIWTNDGSGSFTAGDTLASSNAEGMDMADLDGDHDLDIFITNGHPNPNTVWLNDGDGTFTNSGQSLGNSSSRDVTLGDLDGDGDLDAYVVNSNSGGNTVWLNNGSGTFTDNTQSLGDNNSFSVGLGDLDGDGDLDAFVANNTEGGDGEPNKVWRNGPPPPDVTVSKTVSPASAQPGDSITYTLTFSNAGGIATGVVITDSVPVSVTSPTVLSSSGAAITLTGSAPNFVWDVADLAPGQGGIITLTGALAEPLAAGVFTNTAQIAYAGAEDDETNNTDKAGLTVQNVAPVADADSDQYVLLNATVTLNGSASSDANGDALTYGWAQTGGTSVTLSDAAAESPTFTAPGSATVLTFTLSVTDSLGMADPTPDQVVVTVTEVVTHYVFLPVLANNSFVAPDLVVQSITATGTDVQVVVANQGDAPVTGEFWVEAYVDPDPAPTAVNQPWWDLGDEGIFWGVSQDLLPLDPGETITLTVGDASYDADYSRVSWPLAAGTPVYAQVDAYDEDTTYGAVLESHEITGAPYNNIATTDSVD
jgi:uncharacterized repeat protein (TIGR01451 family)